MEGSYSDDNIYEELISSDDDNISEFNSDNDISELIVSRMKLRMRFNHTKSVPNPRFHIVDFCSQKTHLDVDGISDIVMPHSYPPNTCSVPIHLQGLPFIGRRILSHSLAKMNVNEEFRHEITTKVLDFASGTTNPSFIDIDIKVISASYLMGREDELTWDCIEGAFKDMTNSLFVEEDDQDYYMTLLFPCWSYMEAPCEDRGHLRAMKANNGVMEAQTCAICLDDLDDILNVNVLSIMPCNHLFHKHCVLAWLRRNNGSTCPLCRSTIKLYPS